jgi:hypothetical protein
MSDQEPEMLFVGIKEPSDIRKSLLESSRSVIQCLQKYEKLALIREEKEKEINRLKGIIKEVQESFNKLKASLPRTGLKSLTEEQEKEQEEKLEEELDKIEDARIKSIEKEKDREDDLIDAEIEAIRKNIKKKKPRINIKTKQKKAKEEKIPEPVVVEPVKIVKKKELSELEKLESDLMNIESKLDSL